MGARIRALVWAAPVLGIWQPACSGNSSCGDSKPPRSEMRVAFAVLDGGAIDTSPLTSREACATICAQNTGGMGSDYACRSEAEDGGVVLVCSFIAVCEGRCPDGFQRPSLAGDAPLLGRYFAAMAAAEAASVIAFERMAEEIEEHGLAPALAVRARRAAADEARHFRMTAALARRFGVDAKPGLVAERTPRSLFEMAVENAREGVVRETFGAAAGLWQAHHATERSVRRAMSRIADDEVSHAELSWELDAALRERLSDAERRALDLATARALDELDCTLAAEVAGELVARAGLPDRGVARALLAAGRASLWS